MNNLKKLTIMVLATILFLSGCSLPGLSSGTDESVRITSLSTTESQIMTHMLRLMIEHDTDGNIQPTIINNLGSSTIQHNALVNGDANMSGVRYSGTDLTGALDMEPITDPDEAMKVTQDAFQKEYNQKFFDSYGFDNTYSLMVTKEVAEEYDLETISDLEPYKDELEVGADSAWLNRPGDGYPGFIERYDFSFDSVTPMQIGLVYDALNTGSLDVAVGYNTDGRVAAYDLVVLEDDLQFLPPYDASPFATEELLEEYPEIEASLNKLVGQISTETIQTLNYEADGEGKEPALVAEEFLEAHDYFEDEGEE